MTDAVLVVLGRGQLDPATPVVRADDLAVLRGEGVFETVYLAQGRAVGLDAHLERLAVSAERVDITAPPPRAWRHLVAEVLANWSEPEGLLRLVCTKGPAGGSGEAAPLAYGLATPVPSLTVAQREHGVSAISLSLGVPAAARAEAPWLLGGVKSTSYAVNMAVLRTAAARGADDVVLVSSDDEVLEGPTCTVVWITGDELVTPPPAEVGILAGTTVHTVLALAPQVGLRPTVRRGPVAELRTADEAALVSSGRLVAPLLRLDDQPIGTGAVGPVVRRLQAAVQEWLRTG